MDKAEVLLQYLSQAPNMDLIAFQFGKQESGGITLNTISSDSTIKTYIDGGKLKYFDFAISIYADMTDDPFVKDNLNSWYNAQKFNEWIQNQNKQRNYPDFGETCEIDRISALQNMPSVSRSSAEKTAKYLFMCRVEYVEYEE